MPILSFSDNLFEDAYIVRGVSWGGLWGPCPPPPVTKGAPKKERERREKGKKRERKGKRRKEIRGQKGKDR